MDKNQKKKKELNDMELYDLLYYRKYGVHYFEDDKIIEARKRVKVKDND